jgi:hypothetical protein
MHFFHLDRLENLQIPVACDIAILINKLTTTDGGDLSSTHIYGLTNLTNFMTLEC